MNAYCLGSISVTDELYHHGILGQKWGVRRYQRLNGTLTPAGRERYGKDISSVSEGKLKRQNARNMQYNGVNRTEGFRKEMKLSKQFVRELDRNYKDNNNRYDYKKAKDLGEKYIRDLAKRRLEDMGYESNDNNISTLAGKKWFRNTSYITNTLASIGVEGAEHTRKDDYIYK